MTDGDCSDGKNGAEGTRRVYGEELLVFSGGNFFPFFFFPCLGSHFISFLSWVVICLLCISLVISSFSSFFFFRFGLKTLTSYEDRILTIRKKVNDQRTND